MDRLTKNPRAYKHEWFTVDFDSVEGVFVFKRPEAPVFDKALPYSIKVVFTSGAVVDYHLTEDHAKDVKSAFETYLIFHDTVH